jgi:hypothetical protein
MRVYVWVSQKGSSERSINQILQAAFHILTYEKVKSYIVANVDALMRGEIVQKNRPSDMGASVFGPNEVYQKLTALKARLLHDAQGKVKYAGLK